MLKEGKYIYGIINSSTKKSFNGVYTISYKDISAAVSDSDIVDYTHMFKDALAGMLVSHQKVLEGIMSEHTIIPMRLGTFAVDGDEVRHILAKGYPTIKDIFNKIKGKIEIDVAAMWNDFNLVLKEVGEEKEIMEFKERLFANSEGITIDDQIRVGTMVKKVLNEKREKFAFQIQDDLKSVSEDFKAHELMDDKMIINTAFLINKTQHEDFDRKVEEINTEFAEKLNFRCVGPLPPYSFYTLEIKKMQFEEVDWARKRLGLDGFTINKNKIKKAYKKSAFLSHPDKNPDTPDIEKKFNEINKSYKILIDYCLAAQQASQKENFSFNKEEYKKNAILVKVRE